MIEKFSPKIIVEALRKIDPKINELTNEQSDIISIKSNPLEPSVVIAGAGSGKTETMSNRVLYLVANGFVTPDEILGLTFTRKAAGELSTRIRRRLRQLSASGLVDRKLASMATVTTYHSYAGKLLSEHSIRLGIDADNQPLGEAAIWQIASDVVRNWPDDEYRNESKPSTVIKDLIGLSREVLEHRADLDQIRKQCEEIISELSELNGTVYPSIKTVLKVAHQRISILPMVQTFLQRRKDAGELSFDDQMAIAADIAEQFSDVALLERSKYKVVLLDEYQDTSQSQVRMLSSLFGDGHPVMAVGDPSQAIYTWRGASAGTMKSFENYFPKIKGQLGQDKFTLSTTFRNDELILGTANQISKKIKEAGGQEVLQLKARVGAGKGNLACGVFENIELEAKAIADYFEPLWFDQNRLKKDDHDKTSFAVLVRNRKQITEIELELRARKIPVEVLGVGGLIHVPEIADILTIMKIIVDPDSGSSLMRHLTGPRINLGAQDIAGLGTLAKERARSARTDSKSIIKKIAAGNPDQLEADDQFAGSIIDVLDEIISAPRELFSAIGYQRLLQFATDLRRLRSRSGGAITDLIAEIGNYLSLETQIALRDGSQSGMRNLDRFMDEAAKFERSGGNAREFLEWLDVASDEEGGLKLGAPEIRRDVVQILTVHMAKGAEWDVVAIPGLAKDSFPSANNKSSENWLSNEKHIPFPLRGDYQELPRITFAGVTETKEADSRIKDFASNCAHLIKEREEIRLAYVAITRAKTDLLCTTSIWRDGVTPREPSSIYKVVEEYVRENSGSILSEIQMPATGSRNPSEENPREAIWPRDPLGDRRENFDAAIKLVQTSTEHDLAISDNAVVNSWVNDARALIAEAQDKLSGRIEVVLPARLSTSALVALHENRDELAFNIRRPMPRGQDPYSRRGSAFHLWVEKQFDIQPELFGDEYLDYLDPIEIDTTLEELKNKWLSSLWAKRRPFAVEVPFESVIAGILIRGRIDAIYKSEDGFEVVDWKTGSKKLNESAAVQLAMYRLAWSKLSKTDISKVSAAFHYVPTGLSDKPADLLNEDQLIALISAIEEVRFHEVTRIGAG